MKKLTILIVLLITVNVFGQKYKNLASTPPMGWNSWNKFGCDINEELIRETADAMVASGMKDAGYVYINIDDCWHGQRDSLGFIQPDPDRFPSGMKTLADYVHSKGLKFGIYSDAGWRTCAGRPGSRGYEFQDALTYAQWGVDYLKYDWCNTEGLNAEGAYMTMAAAIRKAGRPIVLSICEWGNNEPWTWGKKPGHLWRTTGDITDCFDCIDNHGTWVSSGILSILDRQVDLRSYAGPDHWNDPDMMEVGNAMSVNEDRAHFSMWCMLAAPLIAGNDLRNMTPETIEILTNHEVIAVDQDSLGIPGFRYLKMDELEIWVKPLRGREYAVCFLNRDTDPMKIEYDWKGRPIKDDFANYELDFNKQTFKLRDLWARKSLGNTKSVLKVTIPGHDVLMLRLTK
jgi:alpha-galactosidase